MSHGYPTPLLTKRGSPERGVSDRLRPVLIINADDWGADSATTDRSLDCWRRGLISSVSAMVFMRDSERSAQFALQQGLDAGLHLNFTTPFAAAQCRPRLIEHQETIGRFLKSHRLAPVLYHPGLAASFEYVVKAQLEQYEELYGAPANRVDGHHHMHLCANVLRQRLLPTGTIVRRNLSFAPGEKGLANRLYRRLVDCRLARRHRMADFFFNLHPLEPSVRLKRIFELGLHFSLEIETHPIMDAEYKFLMCGDIKRLVGDGKVAQGYILASRGLDADTVTAK